MIVESRDLIGSPLPLLSSQIRTEFLTLRPLSEPSNVTFCLSLPDLEKKWRKIGGEMEKRFKNCRADSLFNHSFLCLYFRANFETKNRFGRCRARGAWD